MYPSSQRKFPNSTEFSKVGNRLSAIRGETCRRSTEESCAFAEKSLEKVCGILENYPHDGLDADDFVIPYYNTIREYFLIEYNNISIVKLYLEFRVLLRYRVT